MNERRMACMYGNINCFGNRNGNCFILRDTHFGKRGCSFRKTREQAEIDRKKAKERQEELALEVWKRRTWNGSGR